MKRVKSLAIVVCLLVASFFVVSSAKDDITLYRNVNKDFALEEVTEEADPASYEVRKSTVDEWILAIAKAQNLTEITAANVGEYDLFYQVGMLEDYSDDIKANGVSVRNNTVVVVSETVEINGKEITLENFEIEFQAGDWFGFNAVLEGKAGTDTEYNVYIVDKAGNKVGKNVTTKVKGFVDVAWEVTCGDETIYSATEKVTVGKELSSKKAANAVKKYIAKNEVENFITFSHDGWSVGGSELEFAQYIDVDNAAQFDGKTIKLELNKHVAEFSVQYVVDGETVDQAMVPFGGELEYPEAPAKDGYRFLGWTLDAEELSEDVLAEVGAEDGDIIKIEAKFAAEDAELFEVKFVVDESRTITKEAVEGDTVAVPSVKKAGYKLLGWYDGDVKYTAKTVGEAKTLTAKWAKVNTITVGGESLTYTEDITLPGIDEDKIPAKHTFGGWAYNGTVYATTAGLPDGAQLEAVFVPYDVVETEIKVLGSEFTFAYDAAVTEQDIIDAFLDGVYVKGTEQKLDEEVVVKGLDTNASGSAYTVTLKYEGRVDDAAAVEYVAADEVTVKVKIDPVVGEVKINSQIVRYGEEIAPLFQSEALLFKVIAGVDGHDERNIAGSVQISIPHIEMGLGITMFDGLENFAEGKGYDLNDLTIDELIELLEELGLTEEAKFASLVDTYRKYEDSINKVIDLLEKVAGKLGVNTEMNICMIEEKDLVVPTDAGAYIVAAVIADENYSSAMDAGYLVIHPDGTRTNLAWNQNDSNYILTIDTAKNFNYGATTDIAEAQKEVRYFLVGVNDDKEFYFDLYTDATLPTSLEVGAYGEVAFVSEWDNEMFYAVPIARPIVVTPNYANVQILDANGNVNRIQKYVYGQEIGMNFAVDGEANVPGLKVKYIGLDTTLDGWYRETVPTESGVYMVVAYYTEADAEGDVYTAGADAGVLVIQPADADLEIKENVVCYDGEEHFAQLTEGFDYVKVAYGFADNTIYVNVPDEFKAQIEGLVSKLPGSVEEYVNEKLAKYDYIQAGAEFNLFELKADLTGLIDKVIEADTSAIAIQKSEQALDALLDAVRESEKIDSLVQQAKAKALALKEKVGAKLPEGIAEQIDAYINAAVTVDGTNIDVHTEEIKAKVYELIGKLAEVEPGAAAEIESKFTAIVNKVENHVNFDAVEAKLSDVLANLYTMDAKDVNRLMEELIDLGYNVADKTTVDETVETYMDAIVEKVLTRADSTRLAEYTGYAEKLYEVMKGVARREYTLDDFETYVDENVLVALKDFIDEKFEAVLNKVNEKAGMDLIDANTKIVLGKDPSAEGMYVCMAVNVSKNYMPEVLMPDLDAANINQMFNLKIVAHDWADAVVENETAATCTTDGSYDLVVYCNRCGLEDSRETVVVPALGHDLGEVKVENEVPATHLLDGSFDEVRYCSRCDYEECNTISVPHGCEAAEPVKENVVEPTCTEKGSYDLVVYCTKHADEEISRTTYEVDALGHTPGEAVKENEVEATCTEEGSYEEVVYCTVCGEEISRVTKTVKAHGHKPGNVQIENYVAPTETEDGSYDAVVYCTVCGEEISREHVIIPATGEAKPEPEVKPEVKPESPKTGDVASPFVWVAVAVACLAVVFVTLQTKRNRR